MQSLFDYLAGQKHLEELALRELKVLSVGVGKSSKLLKFPLKRISLSQADLLPFMNNFSETVEELEWLGKEVPESLYKLIFTKFHKLKSLNIRLHRPPTEDDFFKDLRPNYSVRKLVVQSNRNSYLKPLQAIIGNLPNIETLVLNTDSLPRTLMVFIANNLLKLKHLQLKGVTASFFDGVKMESLTSISVMYICLLAVDKDFWKAMIKGFPNLESFSVRLSKLGNKRDNKIMFRTILNGWAHLKHFKMGGLRADAKFKQFLLECKELRTVDIDEDAFYVTPPEEKEAILKASKQNGLSFTMHQNLYNQQWDFHKECNGLWHNEKPGYESESDEEYDSGPDDEYIYYAGNGKERSLSDENYEG